MGFLPQVEWILRHIQVDHQTMLFSATLDGAVDRSLSSIERRSFTVAEPEVTVKWVIFYVRSQNEQGQVAARIIRKAPTCFLRKGADQLERASGRRRQGAVYTGLRNLSE